MYSNSNNSKVLGDVDDEDEKVVVPDQLIKQDDKFLKMLLSREKMMMMRSKSNNNNRIIRDDNQSFRISLAIPFEWESEPGTPKHNFHNNNLYDPFLHHPNFSSQIPTLTPPPSYNYFNTPSRNHLLKSSSSSSKFNFFHTLFPKFINHHHHPKRSSSAIDLSSSSSPLSFRLVSMGKHATRRILRDGSSSSTTTSFDFRSDNYEDDDYDSGSSHTSSKNFMCFGIHRTTRRRSCRRRSSMRYPPARWAND